MMIALTPHQLKAVLHTVEASEDAEHLSGGGFACDIYEVDPPIALEFYPVDGGLDVVAAFVLNYDEAMDGYYLGEKLETEQAVLDAMRAWPPLEVH